MSKAFAFVGDIGQDRALVGGPSKVEGEGVSPVEFLLLEEIRKIRQSVNSRRRLGHLDTYLQKRLNKIPCAESITLGRSHCDLNIVHERFAVV